MGTITIPMLRFQLPDTISNTSITLKCMSPQNFSCNKIIKILSISMYKYKHISLMTFDKFSFLCPFQGYKVFYTTNPDLPIVLWMNQEVAGDNKMTTISYLMPNSTYTICVLAYSSMGQGPLSVPVQVVTRQGGMYCQESLLTW